MLEFLRDLFIITIPDGIIILLNLFFFLREYCHIFDPTDYSCRGDI